MFPPLLPLMQWVASTLHTTSEHAVSSITTADAAHLGCQQSTELTQELDERITLEDMWHSVFWVVPSVWNVCAEVSEHPVSSILIGGANKKVLVRTTDELGTDSVPKCRQIKFRRWASPKTKNRKFTTRWKCEIKFNLLAPELFF